MKKILFAAALFVGSLLLPGCDDGLICRRGDGPLVEETRVLPAFSRIEMKSAMDVTLIPNETYQVVLRAQDNVLEILETRVSGDKLILDLEECLRSHEPIHVEVYAPVFEGVHIKGSGDLDAVAPLVTPGFSLQIDGSGDAVLDLETELAQVFINGSGDVTFSGSATRQELDINGSGSIRAYELWTSSTSLLISGSGDCRIYAEDELAVRISGSGTVFYKGYPMITDLVISGSGEVIEAN